MPPVLWLPACGACHITQPGQWQSAVHQKKMMVDMIRDKASPRAVTRPSLTGVVRWEGSVVMLSRVEFTMGLVPTKSVTLPPLPVTPAGRVPLGPAR